MTKKTLSGDSDCIDADFHGNNAAFNCPECGKLFVVSEIMDKNGRECPSCGKSKAFVKGGEKSNGSAWIEYDYTPRSLVKRINQRKSIYE
jgi:DNA-directed RNA polymerase subunit RPC12/RpoP